MQCWKCSLYSVAASQLLSMSVVSSWRGLLLWYHNVATLKLAHWRPQECPHSPYRSFLASNFLSVGFTHSLFFFLCVSFSLSFGPFLACVSRAPQHFAIPPVSLSPLHTHAEGESRPRRYTHRRDNLSLTQRPMQTMRAMHVAKWESREGYCVRLPRFFSLTHALASIYKYIHKALLPWQQGFSYLGMFCFFLQCRNSSLKSIPPLFLLICQPLTVDWFPSPAVNEVGLCLLGLWLTVGSLYTAILPTEEVGWSQQWTIDWRNKRWICAIVLAFVGALLMDKCMRLSLAAIASSI